MAHVSLSWHPSYKKSWIRPLELTAVQPSYHTYHRFSVCITVEGPPLGQFRQIGTNKESLLAPMTCHGDADVSTAGSIEWENSEGNKTGK